MNYFRTNDIEVTNLHFPSSAYETSYYETKLILVIYLFIVLRSIHLFHFSFDYSFWTDKYKNIIFLNCIWIKFVLWIYTWIIFFRLLMWIDSATVHEWTQLNFWRWSFIKDLCLSMVRWINRFVELLLWKFNDFMWQSKICSEN